ncbi:hypothetical protein BDF14DRAFT_1732371 [Spinellus fusiger]|nr:hypothetical protein BDF14DRAFT_1732371 [Spinellus fusiger]
MSLLHLDTYLESYQLALLEDTNTSKGRCVVALETLSRGSVITTSQPLGTVILESEQNEHCNYCFRKPLSTLPDRMPLQRCTQCKQAYFCDADCFKKAWLGYHQYVCTPPRHTRREESKDALEEEMLERVSLNVARYNSKAMDPSHGAEDTLSEEDRQEETVNVTMEAFFSLVGHKDSQPRHLISQYQHTADRVLSKPYMAPSGLDRDQLVDYLCKFQCNNFSIDDGQLFTIGEGTYPVASLFNHSCRPNAIVLFDGALLKIKAIEEIEKGEEITIAYVDVAHSRTVRKNTLRNKYLFECDCVRCTDASFFGNIDRMLGEETSEWDRAEMALNPKGQDSLPSQILQQIGQAWDLVHMSNAYSYKEKEIHEPTDSLTMSSYTHSFLRLVTSYLLISHRCLPEHSMPPTKSVSEASLHGKAQETADDILSMATTLALSYPVSQTSLVPYRLTTLSASTRLFYDEMAEDHWDMAVKLGMYILVQYSFIYPAYHPMMAQHTLLLTKACWNAIVRLDSKQETLALEKVYADELRHWIALSKDTVYCVFGVHSEQWQEVLELETILKREKILS